MSSLAKKQAILDAQLKCNPSGVSNPVVFYDQMNDWQTNWTAGFEGGVCPQCSGYIVQNPTGEPAGTVEITNPTTLPQPTAATSIRATGHSITPAITPFCFCVKIQQNSAQFINTGFFAGLSTFPFLTSIAQIGITSYTVDGNFHLVVQQPALQDFDLGIPVDNAQHTFTVCKITNGLSVQVDNDDPQLFVATLPNSSVVPLVAIRSRAATSGSLYLDSYRLSNAT
jgi:hypothetical protein